MVTIRGATTEDYIEMQQCNLINLPENYSLTYWIYNGVSWPEMTQVAIDDSNGKIVGYCLCKMESEDGKDAAPHGHVASLSVLREYRKLGIANRLMKQSEMQSQIYGAKFMMLHVRVSNRAAIGLYRDVLKY